uniref:RNA helicase n=1 Tax=Dunaliella tertiolecta TaxID=3047 RepID=A0A7S3QW36_DUNTE|mmetsp:Transcript_22898/g.63274  ORF Transcript_22898/g.63274 Transcript_22898/m.63274 type:complete len:554 (-) Transcript_22898:963-2624(-)|eukprot:CAMPEP_0202371392 /NCGR_PEP_ID=MMETSP1127-20130417/2804_1 /ASSEMBLY_ACC=CAM_ASM_000462 /TAXON_ID=3047 /ORGANISM="Dunaliella tertiolecta, Strain CCMP1320" /LENGTH=553 /DNA_ID=CAMNT_0048967629 /DNA_START=65 /DNA_END=1726 /DNA_ORIENTATION=-
MPGKKLTDELMSSQQPAKEAKKESKKRQKQDQVAAGAEDAGVPFCSKGSAGEVPKKAKKRQLEGGSEQQENDGSEKKKSKKAKKGEEACGGGETAGLAAHSGSSVGDSGKAWFSTHSVRVETPPGAEAVVPLQSFTEAGFPADIMGKLTQAGFTSPTPIQASAWPVLLGGRDIVAVSKTGSGKTCGFLLPGMMHIKKAGHKDLRQGPQLLVLAPTRELAVQIKSEADKFGRAAGIRSTCLSGGVPKGPQLRDLNTGVHLAIATPGRLNDFLEAGQVRLGQVAYLVLDEADRMLDMGFEPQIQQIVKTIPAKRQTVFFSATWPMAVRKIASQFVGPRTVHIFVGDGAGVDGKLVANKSITQYVKVVGGRSDKIAELQRILRSKPAGTRFMVFCKTKSMCDQLTTSLPNDLKSAALHGDKMQRERDYVLTAFKRGNTPILVATDVAARGLDIPSVGAVVNFDFPQGMEDYIHRIGRTGRAGAEGESHTFFTSDDAKHARKLSQIMSEANQAVPPELAAMARQGAGGGGGGSRGGYGGSRGYGGGRGGGRGYGRRY